MKRTESFSQVTASDASGTVDGGFLDTRINLDKYWGEMVRYYSNIVGKYGSPVQKALQNWEDFLSLPFALHMDRYGQRIFPE